MSKLIFGSSKEPSKFTTLSIPKICFKETFKFSNPFSKASTQLAACFGEKIRVVRGPPMRRGVAYHVMVSSGYLSRWTVAAGVASILASMGLRVLVFTDSQQMAEVLARIIRRSYGREFLVHRAGLSPLERRVVETKLSRGEVDGVVATPTLELGIDIGYLDAVVMASPPPSYAKYLQRGGRAGISGWNLPGLRKHDRQQLQRNQTDLLREQLRHPDARSAGLDVQGGRRAAAGLGGLRQTRHFLYRNRRGPWRGQHQTGRARKGRRFSRRDRSYQRPPVLPPELPHQTRRQGL